jgi:hypothetical protein
MSTKTFTAARAAERGVKADFDLKWEDDEGEVHTETFFCYPGRAPGAVLFDLTTVGTGSGPMWEFYRAVMGDGYAAFREFVDDGGHGVSADVLRDITSWIIEYDTGLPTPPPAS